MCGIAGWFGRVPFDVSHARAMARALEHRGPDAEGICSWPDATLIHRRLSIIDLSSAGEQPLTNEDGSVRVVFNGEIYNHHALREDLERDGHRFRGHSDSEVLPHLYETKGAALLPELRGMFAFAIFDERKRHLLLARDRFGIKPLFYSLLPDGIVFASEINALRLLPSVDLTVDQQALNDYTALTWVPAPATFFRGIRALEPGCQLEADVAGDSLRIRITRYHSWTIAPREDRDLRSAADDADRVVRGAVRSQLESDVPLGALLSGGIDSSLVSVAAQEALAPSRLLTFNVRFPDEQYDETWAARAVADSAGTLHETLDFHAGSASWSEITALLAHAGQPFADTSLFAVNAVSRLIRRRVTVALSGDGGDEAFGGYDLYWQLGHLARLQSLPSPILGAGVLALKAAGLANDTYARLGSRLRELGNGDDAVVGMLFRWIREEELRRLLPGIDAQPVSRLFAKQWRHELPANASRVERLSAHATEINTRLVLPNDFLFKVDMASMRESLEVRVPMLDEDLFALGMTLPHRLKVRKKTAKLVLRELAKRRLPREVAEKPKWGFGVPLDTWTGDEFRTALRDTLTASSPIAQFYDPAAYLPIINAFCDRTGTLRSISRQGLYQRVILLLAVHLTLERTRAERAAA